MIGYLDTPSGISGDMFLGCLVDAGWPIERLQEAITRMSLPDGSWSVAASEQRRGAFRATMVDVQAHEDAPPHRHFSTIRKIIEAADLADTVKDGAIAAFQRLAQAEAKVHGSTIEKVHFHEVGAIDAIIDIVGVATGLNDLGIERLFASPLPLGHGWTDSQHGSIPLPAPATLEILAAAGAPTRPAPGQGELVTPTGAALLAQFAEFTQPVMSIERIAIGCGQKDFDWPNIARLWLGRLTDEGPIVQIEANIDDMNPQFYGQVCEKLFAAGALDVWLTPVQMKKHRPGTVLSVLAPSKLESAVAELILRETTTLGMRVHQVHRHEAQREIRAVETQYGEIRLKLKRVDGRLIGYAPEYDDCLRAAEQYNVPVREVHVAAMSCGAYGEGESP